MESQEEDRIAGMRLIATLSLLVILASCADDPQLRWAQMQGVYNTAMTEVVRLRDPCVVSVTYPNGSKNHPRCFISDKMMKGINTAREKVRDYLDRALVAAELENEDRANALMDRAEAPLEDLLFDQLRAASAAGGTQ